MSVAFNTSQPIEWFDVDTVTRVLNCLPAHVFQLIESGRLRARNVNGEARISSASLDQYTATRPLFGKPQPDTYIKVNGRVYLEVTK